MSDPIVIIIAAAVAVFAALAGRAWLERLRAKRTADEVDPAELDERDDPETTTSSAAPDDVTVMPIEESIDLHFFAPRDVPSVVDEYLREAALRGFETVRIIHGRGKGVQRQRVQKILERHPLVRSFQSDGLGSTLTVLHRKTTSRSNQPRGNQPRGNQPLSNQRRSKQPRR